MDPAELEREAARRGAAWADRVVRGWLARWPALWPRTPRALSFAGRQIADLVGSRADLQGRLARFVVDAAAKRYAELTRIF